MITTLFDDRQEGYNITIMLGSRADIVRYLNRDDSILTYNAGMPTGAGDIIGFERYGGMGMGRELYPVTSSIVDIPAENFLAWDAMHGGDVLIAGGTEESLNVLDELKGVRHLVYRIKFTETVRRPSASAASRPIRLLN